MNSKFYIIRHEPSRKSCKRIEIEKEDIWSYTLVANPLGDQTLEWFSTELLLKRDFNE